nr:M28 family peptidase [Anaerolineae bacterium]
MDPAEPGSENSVEMLLFNGEMAYRHVVNQVAIGPRPTGSAELLETARYILESLQAYGWEVSVQEFVYLGTTGRNITAYAPGERNCEEEILLGAHYDTRRLADQDLEHPELPVLGANDGASGVAVLLEIGRVLAGTPYAERVRLVFFDAEDNGRLDGWEYVAGSRYYAQQMQCPPREVIIVDMVGDADQQIYYDANSDSLVRERLWTIALQLGYGEYFIPEIGYAMLDDHIPFVEQGIPSVDIIDFNYPYWHTTHDSLDKISVASLERVGRVLEYYLRQ